MSKQTTKTVKTETAVDATMLNACVINLVSYAQLQDDISDKQARSEQLRNDMVEGLKALKDKKWKDISSGVKAALAEIQGIDQVGALGTLKTCFEYRILPITLNADRLRKAKQWKNWNGYTVPNTYGKVHTKPGAGQKATDKVEAPEAEEKEPHSKALEAIPNVLDLATMAPGADKKAAPTKSEAPKSTTGKAELPRVNVDGSETPIGQFEHWETLYKQFTNHGVSTYFVRHLAGALGIEADKLMAAWIHAHHDLIEEAEKLDPAKKATKK